MNSKIIKKTILTVLMTIILMTMLVPNIAFGATATGISLSKSSIALSENGAESLFAKLSPANTSSEVIEWQNSNPKAVALERTIANGTYYIKSALNEKKTLDIKSSSTANKVRVQLWNKNNSVAQRFYISSVGNGYYTITAQCSNKAIEVANSSSIKGTAVQQNDPVNKNKQKWEFEYAGNGFYYIKSKCNGLYLDVTGGKSDNGTPLQVWSENRSKSQKFKLELVKKSTKGIQDGTYNLITALDSSKYIGVRQQSTENGAKIVVANSSTATSKQFEFINVGNGYYTIRAKHSGKSIDVTGGNVSRGTKIQQWNTNYSDAQLWKLESAGNGYYYIKSKSSGLYLDVTGGKAVNGRQLQIWTSNNTNSQKFKLKKVSNKIKYNNFEIVTVKPKAGGTATITAKLANGKTAKCTVITTTNILFIGNDATEENRMPDVFYNGMLGGSKAKPYYNIESLTNHWTTLYMKYQQRDTEPFRNGKTLAETVKSKRWDYLVLQDFDGLSYEELRNGTANIIDYMRNNGSPNVKIIYNSYFTPSYVHSGNQDLYNLPYERVASEAGYTGKIAYTGNAFLACNNDKQGKKVNLYYTTDYMLNRPTPEGSFLEAACIYSAMFGKPTSNISIYRAWKYHYSTYDEAYDINDKTQQLLWEFAKKVQ